MTALTEKKIKIEVDHRFPTVGIEVEDNELVNVERWGPRKQMHSRRL
jgi:hypothetical protein